MRGMKRLNRGMEVSLPSQADRLSLENVHPHDGIFVQVYQDGLLNKSDCDPLMPYAILMSEAII